jgi:Holliday junction resolvase
MTAIETERRVLSLLRSRFEADGYSFVEFPESNMLPEFMQGYRPDAIALREGKSIAIEVKLRRDPNAEKNLRSISERFKGHPSWELRIVYGDDVRQEPLQKPTLAQLEQQISEAEDLLRSGHHRAALVLGWAAIEAIARKLGEDFPASGASTMRQAVELLEHMGHLRFEEAQQLRTLLPLRSRVVHGDLSMAVSHDEVAPVLSAARAALEASKSPA